MASQRKSNDSYTSEAVAPRSQPGANRGSGDAPVTLSRGTGAAIAPSAPYKAPAPRSETRNIGAEAAKAGTHHNEIERAAYFRWLRQGGDPATNWLAAEAELKGRAALKI